MPMAQSQSWASTAEPSKSWKNLFTRLSQKSPRNAALAATPFSSSTRAISSIPSLQTARCSLIHWIKQFLKSALFCWFKSARRAGTAAAWLGSSSRRRVTARRIWCYKPPADAFVRWIRTRRKRHSSTSMTATRTSSMLNSNSSTIFLWKNSPRPATVKLKSSGMTAPLIWSCPKLISTSSKSITKPRSWNLPLRNQRSLLPQAKRRCLMTLSRPPTWLWRLRTSRWMILNAAQNRRPLPRGCFVLSRAALVHWPCRN